MSRSIVIILSLINVVVFLIILGSTVSAFSGPKENKAQSQGVQVKALSGQECDDGVLAKGSSECVPKETGTAKKKVIKQAGKAAAVGVAGKKVSSGIKDKVSED